MESCWLAICGKVYDVTDFLKTHPGGAETLLQCAGGDATADYDAVGHSAAAKKMLAKYYVGECDGAGGERGRHRRGWRRADRGRRWAR